MLGRALAQLWGKRTNLTPTPNVRATIVFVHIPKTGGTSLALAMREFIKPGGRFRMNHPVEGPAQLASFPVSRRRNLVLVEGHIHHGIHTSLVRPAAYITVLREPVERVSSFYHFVRRSTWHHLHTRLTELTLNECFRQRVTVELDNFMTRCLSGTGSIGLPFGAVTREMFQAAAENLSNMALVGTTDRLHELEPLVPLCLDLPRISVPRANAGPDAMHVSRLSEEERALIRRHNLYDIELYALAGRFLSEKLRTCGVTGTPVAISQTSAASRRSSHSAIRTPTATAMRS